jgi:hypothetical protein
MLLPEPSRRERLLEVLATELAGALGSIVTWSRMYPKDPLPTRIVEIAEEFAHKADLAGLRRP